jgi:hypothetical protein
MQKRGRPHSANTDDLALMRRRQLTAERVRQFRQRRNLATAAAQPQTGQQLQLAETVTERPFKHAEAALTLQSIGLRVQNLVLAQDASDAQLQQDAIHVDEHHALYDQTEPTRPATPAAAATAAPIATATTAVALHGRHQSTLTRFFATLPPANPFAAARPIAGEAAAEVASGTREDLQNPRESDAESS